MKVSKLILAVLFTFSFFFAQASSDPNKQSQLRSEIMKLLKNVEWNEFEQGTLKITFVITNNNEIIVSHTNDEEFDALIKSKLNYQKVKVDGIKPFEIFQIPITVKK
jgi:hypothetical protein